MNNQSGPGRDLPPQRKGIFYLGITFLVMGSVVLLSALLTSQLAGQNNTVRIIAPLSFILIGVVLMRVARSGLAVLDKVQSRPAPLAQHEPWKKLGLDDGDDLVESALYADDGSELPLDEQLSRLDQLRVQRLITEEKFQAKRASLLAGER